MADPTTLDLRSLAPRERHDLIFERLADLATGDTLRLINDHDPKPLRYQLDAECPHQFAWEPVETGPQRWIIDITNTASVVDARPILAAGDEPFHTIMDAAAQITTAGQALVVYAPFEPVPLEGVLAEQGFTHVARELPGGDWQATFTKT